MLEARYVSNLLDSLLSDRAGGSVAAVRPCLRKALKGQSCQVFDAFRAGLQSRRFVEEIPHRYFLLSSRNPTEVVVVQR